MKYYSLSAIINGDLFTFKKKFRTRNAALDYIFKQLESKYYHLVQVEEIVEKENKHDLEYICDDENRFRISRKFVM